MPTSPIRLLSGSPLSQLSLICRCSMQHARASCCVEDQLEYLHAAVQSWGWLTLGRIHASFRKGNGHSPHLSSPVGMTEPSHPIATTLPKSSSRSHRIVRRLEVTCIRFLSTRLVTPPEQPSTAQSSNATNSTHR